MKKNILLICVLVLFNLHTIAQIYQNDVFCGAENSESLSKSEMPWLGNNQFLTNYLDSIGYFTDIDDTVKIIYRVPLKIWIYRFNNGEGGVHMENIKKYITQLNHYYALNKVGIAFYLREIDYVDKNKFDKFGYNWEAPINTTFRKTEGCINIHMVNYLKKPGKYKRDIEFKGTYNKVNRAVIVDNTLSSTVLSHEVGHYFGLLHPHNNYKKGKRKQESVSRTRKASGFKKGLNCEHNGDGICDTPAEPDLNKVTDNRCQFTGLNMKDNWGDLYKPATDNIMSYQAYKTCRSKFTRGQIAVMLYSAEKNSHSNAWKSIGSDNKSVNRQYYFDSYEPDNVKEMAGEIITGKMQQHTFHKIYTGKKGKDMDADVDWLYFLVNNPKKNSFQLKIYTGTSEPALFVVEVYNSAQKVIAQSESNSLNQNLILDLRNLSNDNYFIKVSKKGNIAESKNVNYSIELTNIR